VRCWNSDGFSFSLDDLDHLWACGRHRSWVGGDTRYEFRRCVMEGVEEIGAIGVGSSLYVCSDVGEVYKVPLLEYESLGNAEVEQHELKSEKINKLNNIVQVEASGNSALFLDYQGIVWGMGSNQNGLLGLGASAAEMPRRIRKLPKISCIAMGIRHSLFVGVEGAVYSSGSNFHGQLGVGGAMAVTKPTQVPKLPKIIAASCGAGFSMVLSESGEVFTFGDNSSGQLGHGDTLKRNIPKKILPEYFDNVPIDAISCGSIHSLCIDMNGNLWSFGAQERQPSQVDLPASVRYISQGGSHVIIKDDSGIVWGWGPNYNGQLGLAEGANNYTTPIRLTSEHIMGKRAIRSKSARK